jgi:hypothetical protein
MKSVVGLAVLAATVLATPAAAGRENERMVWRIRAGINTSTFAGSDADRGDLERRQGAIVGLSILYHATPRIGLELGGFYSQKGSKVKISETEEFQIPLVGGTFEATAKSHYVELPVLLNFTFPVRERFATRVYAGPALALETSAWVTGTAGSDLGGSATRTIDTDVSSYTTNFDMAGVVGATAVVETGPVNLLLDIRWSRGLRTVDDSGLDLDVLNSTFSFMVGIGVPASGGSGEDDGPRRVFQ